MARCAPGYLMAMARTPFPASSSSKKSVQDAFLGLFKAAWQPGAYDLEAFRWLRSRPTLRVIGDGENFIPPLAPWP